MEAERHIDISLRLFGERGPEFTYFNIIIFAAFLLLEKRDSNPVVKKLTCP